MLKKLLTSPRIQELRAALEREENLLLEGLWDAPKALVATLAAQATGKHVLILTGASQEELRLYHDFSLFSDLTVLDYPAWETLPAEGIPPSPDIVGERYDVLQHLVEAKQPYVIVSSLQACLQKLIPPSDLKELYLTIHKGDTLPLEELVERLLSMGYQRCPVAADKGEFAIRGGIIDVYPVGAPDACRIEYWGDEVESLRNYDPISQKSQNERTSLALCPAQELELLEGKDRLASILDYLGDQAIVFFDELLDLEDRYAALKQLSDTRVRTFATMEGFFEELQQRQRIYSTQAPLEQLSEVQVTTPSAGSFYSAATVSQGVTFDMFQRKLEAQRFKHPFRTVSDYLMRNDPSADELSGEEVLDLVSGIKDTETEVVFLCDGEGEEETLRQKLKDRHLVLPRNSEFNRGYLSSGLAVEDLDLVLIPNAELTHRYKIRRQKLRSTYHSPPTDLYELTSGDAVVHLNNGIGIFLGMERKTNHEGHESEFMTIEYADKAKLYVPLNQAHLISKYIGANESKPKLHTLGSSRWKKAKQQTERAIMGYASELLHISASREVKGGFAYRHDSDELRSFENEFPFVETEDQVRAVQDIKKDMVSQKAMDRLVCGDVGYGKTEVAMRAAFKAVLDGGKQVALLVPTTMLAMQHYESFCERMANFPVRVGVISRFLSPKQQKETLQGVADGSIDILIGTHRIVSKDVHFKNLGLILIDEEQRFGVKAKEHLKKIKTNVDCITLTATPIPRTLYMSLVGVRDLSVISTPPQDRLPIKTVLAESDDEVIKSALLRELTRDGQAYFIHNRVETIFEVAAHIKKLLPQARVVVGHGQMSSDELDTVFHQFKSGKADILVATTIVENGIDMPNANTILIDRADRFGLASLYQLRGRVGRWNRRAYAYMLVPRLRSLPEISRKRLHALQEAGGYGGGMKLALRDLELRGAGDILGLEQSGHISSIGFHLYCKMLKRTIQTLQGEIPSVLADTKVEGPFPARLPEEYVNEVSLRMEIYQRLGESITWDEVTAIYQELKDRFGAPPEQAKWLYHMTRLRVFAARNGFTLLKFGKMALTAERQLGKDVKSKQILLKLPQTPIDLESKVIQALKKEFRLREK